MTINSWMRWLIIAFFTLFLTGCAMKTTVGQYTVRVDSIPAGIWHWDVTSNGFTIDTYLDLKNTLASTIEDTGFVVGALLDTSKTVVEQVVLWFVPSG